MCGRTYENIIEHEEEKMHGDYFMHLFQICVGQC